MSDRITDDWSGNIFWRLAPSRFRIWFAIRDDEFTRKTLARMHREVMA